MNATEILQQQIEAAQHDLQEINLQEVLLRREQAAQLAKLQQQKEMTEERIKVWTEAIKEDE
jgi:hypothetical protein